MQESQLTCALPTKLAQLVVEYDSSTDTLKNLTSGGNVLIPPMHFKSELPGDWDRYVSSHETAVAECSMFVCVLTAFNFMMEAKDSSGKARKTQTDAFKATVEQECALFPSAISRLLDVFAVGKDVASLCP